MYELSVLSILMERVAHGYLIARIINDMIGPFAKISFGRLYPLLTKLEQQGLISVYTESDTSEDAQHGRRYRITEAGRKRFHQLMMDTRLHPGDYHLVFLQKVCVFDHLTHKERVYLIDHYINYCQTHILHIHAETDDLTSTEKQDAPEQLDNVVCAMQHRADVWQTELAWAQRLQAREMTKA